ncbi:SpoIIE family protein phosphatase [Dactylosporangium vinaceum]|uniref:GAF domain-containing SpoIIE family protein phosphatase n=1 Tax=Dactylosporangium vinaceum TaxID=53362 RepID=A0ABV5MSQ9_9ACTN|nr:GAF domain-containing SpoIIE family protein phosphatase [Dactylosporangium vinaceum]UAC00956.1 SpoIIE family protein phosphatase [Dactylosporangium vinaceum]
MTERPKPGALRDATRLAALDATGLDARADAAFDRFAALASSAIGTPLALVSLVDARRQFFPGQAGLVQPLCDERQTPLSHSFCQQVITTGAPLIVTDARQDARVAGNAAVADLGVIAYAGLPLTDSDGRILGALAVIDHQPRDWNAAELKLLDGIADACAAELRLRIVADQVGRRLAEQQRLAAETADVLASTELLLRASEDLSAATTVDGITAAVTRLLDSAVAPAYVSLGITYADGARRHIRVANVQHPQWEAAWLHDVDTGGSPMLRCVRDNTPVYYAGVAALAADFPDLAGHVVAAGRQSLACLPLPGPAGPIGVIAFWWDQSHAPDAAEQMTLAALAGYTGLAVQRVLLLQNRIDAALALQQAMLTDLPDPAGLALAARYHAAHAGDRVGGDWYDAFHTATGATILVIGDVTGHDITAAGQMGQIRATLRALAHDRDEAPDQILTRTDRTIADLGLDILASAVVVRLSPAPDRPGTYELSWSAAGHPPPLLQHPDGRVEVLTGSDMLLGINPSRPRRSESVALPPGATVLLYTDGLVEVRGVDLRERIADLRDLVADLHHRPLDCLLDTVVETLTGRTHSDDVAVIACRNPGPVQPVP